MNRLRIILSTLLLAVAYVAAGQGYVIDSVCRGAERHYRIDGEAGSTYQWTLTDPSGHAITLPENADTVTLDFNVAAGDYQLSALQTSIHGCDSLQLGTIKVFDIPVVSAGPDRLLCNSNPLTLSDATAAGYSSLLWESNGDGTFDDSTALHPKYKFGAEDIKTGNVIFTMKAFGFGRDGSCPPVESSFTVRLRDMVLPTFDAIGPVCLNSAGTVLSVVSANGFVGTWSPAVINTSFTGTSVYTFTPDAGQCGLVATLPIKVESPEITDVKAYPSTNGLVNGYVVIEGNDIAATQGYSLNGIDWQTSNVFSKLPFGAYTAWVRNENGCVVSQPFNILSEVVGQVKVSAGNDVKCITLPIEIPLKSSGFKNVASFSVTLTYNPAILTYNSVVPMNAAQVTGQLITSQLSPGVLQIRYVANDTLNLDDDKEFLSINFQGVSAGLSDMVWDSLRCVIYSSAGYEMPTLYAKGSVDIRPMPQIYTSGNGGFCENTPHHLGAGSLTGQSLVYTWTSPGGETHNGPLWDLGHLSMNDAGVYVVKASDGTTCEISQSVDLQVYPNPHVSLNNGDTLCTDHEVLLNAGAGFAAYKWQDGSTEPQLMATSEGLYRVTVTDNNGCQATDSVLVGQCELLIHMPNVFSPNGDGINDVFLPRYNPDIPIKFRMLIFNKWGEQIFSTNDISKGWDGTFKGELCKQDVYVWTIIFEAPENYKFMQKSPQSGNVMLIK